MWIKGFKACIYSSINKHHFIYVSKKYIILYNAAYYAQLISDLSVQSTHFALLSHSVDIPRNDSISILNSNHDYEYIKILSYERSSANNINVAITINGSDKSISKNNIYNIKGTQTTHFQKKITLLWF